MSELEKGKELSNNNNNPSDTPPVGSDPATSGGGSDKVYDSSFVDKLKGEKENFRNANQKLADEVAQLKADAKNKADAALKEKEDWKTLYEQQKTENESLTGKLGSAENQRLDAKKETELKKELTKLGLDPKYADKAVKLGNLESVKIDKDTGVIYGAEVVAKSLSEDWPALFGSTPTEKVSQSAPAIPSPTGALSMDEWKKLPYDERKKREGEMMQNEGIQLKR